MLRILLQSLSSASFPSRSLDENLDEILDKKLVSQAKDDHAVQRFSNLRTQKLSS